MMTGRAAARLETAAAAEEEEEEASRTSAAWKCSDVGVVALVVYGPMRFTPLTHASFDARVLRRLRKIVGETDLFIHTLTLPNLAHARSNKADVRLGPSDFVKLFGPACRYEAADQANPLSPRTCRVNTLTTVIYVTVPVTAGPRTHYRRTGPFAAPPAPMRSCVRTTLRLAAGW